MFLDLVGAPSPDDLDDEEAAVLAYAHVHNAVAVGLDDGKAIRILRTRFSSVKHYFTVDLFSAAANGSGLPRSEIERAFQDARQHARMRVPKGWKLD